MSLKIKAFKHKLKIERRGSRRNGTGGEVNKNEGVTFISLNPRRAKKSGGGKIIAGIAGILKKEEQVREERGGF